MKTRRRKGNSRVVVIDACVARAAGETEHPVSSACRRVLEDLRDICHHAVLTPELHEEWNKHRSKFAYRWRGAMARMGKKLQIEQPPQTALRLDGCSEADQDAIRKDRFLLDAALAHDRIIVTSDRRLQEALERFADGRKLGGQITWIDPLQTTRKALEKL